MKVLKILNRINTLALFAYIPYIIFDFDNFFYSKTGGGNIVDLSVAMFFVTFICGGAILVTANKTNVENSFSISEVLKVFGSKRLGILSANFVLSTVLMIVFVRSNDILFYIICSLISTVFVVGETVILEKIEDSPYYKITLPWYVFPVPFVWFLGGSIWAADHLSEAQTEKAIIFIFATTGLMMMYCAWHFSYIIDETNKAIEKEYGVFSFFIPNKTVKFENINYVTKKGFYYIVSDGDITFKIGRHLSGTNRLEKALIENGIYIADSKLM